MGCPFPRTKELGCWFLPHGSRAVNGATPENPDPVLGPGAGLWKKMSWFWGLKAEDLQIQVENKDIDSCWGGAFSKKNVQTDMISLPQASVLFYFWLHHFIYRTAQHPGCYSVATSSMMAQGHLGTCYNGDVITLTCCPGCVWIYTISIMKICLQHNV